MEVKSTVAVLYAKQYAMKDENGQNREGVTLAYIIGDNMAPIMHPDGSLGCRPAKGSLPPAAWTKLPKVPGLYDGRFEMTVGADGKAAMRLVDVDFLAEFELEAVGKK